MSGFETKPRMRWWGLSGSRALPLAISWADAGTTLTSFAGHDVKQTGPREGLIFRSRATFPSPVVRCRAMLVPCRAGSIESCPSCWHSFFSFCTRQCHRGHLLPQRARRSRFPVGSLHFMGCCTSRMELGRSPRFTGAAIVSRRRYASGSLIGGGELLNAH